MYPKFTTGNDLMATAIKLGDWIKQGYAEYVDPKSHGRVTLGNTEMCMVF
jgi:hypothetical protein